MGRAISRKAAAMVLLAAISFISVSSSLVAAEPPRITSMNVCTDQLLLTLAGEQILGLSRYARDAEQSWAASEARAYPILSGGAEDILMLKPDLVLASQFDKRETRDLLRRNGVRLVEFSVPRDLAEVKAQIRAVGAMAGHSDRAENQIVRIDTALERAKRAVANRHFRILPLSRRGWVSGNESLIGSLLKEIGLVNAAAELGVASGGFVSLESIVKLKPDFLLVSESGNRAEDDGRAFLLHPALEQFYPSAKRIVVPERLTVCGGVMLADALDLLAQGVQRVGR